MDSYKIKNAEVVGRITVYKTALGKYESLFEALSEEGNKPFLRIDLGRLDLDLKKVPRVQFPSSGHRGDTRSEVLKKLEDSIDSKIRKLRDEAMQELNKWHVLLTEGYVKAGHDVKGGDKS